MKKFKKMSKHPKNLDDLNYGGQVSDEMLGKLGEQTNGFLLFYLDGDNQIRWYEGFDEGFARAGFAKIATDWADSHSMVEDDDVFLEMEEEDAFLDWEDEDEY